VLTEELVNRAGRTGGTFLHSSSTNPRKVSKASVPHIFRAKKKVVNVKEHYNTDRLRPHYQSFEMKPLFIMTTESV
jgi:hypothetical protein